MLRSLNSGVSAMQQFQGQMDVIANNIANVNTVGFKSARVDFADSFSQVVQGNSMVGPNQVGTGVVTGSNTNQFIQGAITSTGSQNDLAISKEGFFVVRDPLTNAQYATRAGDFTTDAEGYLMTTNGLRVQGYTDSTLSTIGDIKIDNGGSTEAMRSYRFAADGKVMVTLDNSTITRGQILLQKFNNPLALKKEGNNLFSGIDVAGPLTNPSAPNTNGLGSIVERSLEMSNVDLAGEFSDLIVTQRAFQASAKIITTSDEVLQELVNLKR